MRITNTFAAAVTALAILGAGSAAHADVTLSNAPNGSSISSFGYPNSQTYGQVFTAPITGVMTGFTLNLDGGVGSLVGGVGDWSGTSSFSTGGGLSGLLYQSGPVASNGAAAYAFTTNIDVVAGQLYVAYLSVFGLPTDGLTTTSMPLGTDVEGINYFVWHNGGSQQGVSWDYFADFGDAQFSATFSPGGAVPEPTTWAMMLIGFAGLGGALRYNRRRRLQAAYA